MCYWHGHTDGRLLAGVWLSQVEGSRNEYSLYLVFIYKQCLGKEGSRGHNVCVQEVSRLSSTQEL